MKKLAILLICLLLSVPTMAGCLIEGCFVSNKECNENEIKSWDGECHSCFEKDPIKICPMDKDEIEKKCPNRYTGLSDHFSFLEKPGCPKNHFMADDTKCYPCDYDKSIKTEYEDNLLDICPNRLALECGYTVATCPLNYRQKGKSCIRNCAEGYVETKTGRCIHAESGDCYIRSGDGDDLGCSYDYLKCKEGYKKTQYGECINSTGDCYTEDCEGKSIECTFFHE